MLKVYLAGPDVFLENREEIIAEKRRLCRQYGFEPSLHPAEMRPLEPLSPYEMGCKISWANEDLVLGADLIIANLTPFRGISADVGTVFELGLVCALGRPAYGYSNCARPYNARAAEYYGGQIATDETGRIIAPDGQFIENHDMADNLMIDGGIARRGGVLVRRAVAPEDLWSDMGAYEDCLGLARDALMSSGPSAH